MRLRFQTRDLDRADSTLSCRELSTTLMWNRSVVASAKWSRFENGVAARLQPEKPASTIDANQDRSVALPENEVLK